MNCNIELPEIPEELENQEPSFIHIIRICM